MRTPISLVLSAMLLAGCSAHAEVSIGGGRTFTPSEGAIAAKLEQITGQRPRSVDCPTDLPAKVGQTFRCRITARDGSTIGMTGTETDDKGHFRFRVDERGSSG